MLLYLYDSYSSSILGVEYSINQLSDVYHLLMSYTFIKNVDELEEYSYIRKNF